MLREEFTYGEITSQAAIQVALFDRNDGTPVPGGAASCGFGPFHRDDRQYRHGLSRQPAGDDPAGTFNPVIPSIDPGVTLNPDPAFLDGNITGPLNGVTYGPFGFGGNAGGNTGWVSVITLYQPRDSTS